MAAYQNPWAATMTETADRYRKNFPVSWDQLHRDAKALAWRLADLGPWKSVVAITRGGLVPTAIIARELEIRMIDTVCVSSYDHQDQSGIKIIKPAQGDGEVSGTAIEQSLSGRFRLVLHKDMPLSMPRVETDAHYILMGIDLDLDRALQQAVNEVVSFLVEEKGLTPTKAVSLASIAVDFQVAEAVDLTQLVTGKIPKSIFR